MVPADKVVKIVAKCIPAVLATKFATEPTTLVSLWSRCLDEIVEIGSEILKEKHSTRLKSYTDYGSDLFKPSKVDTDLTMKDPWKSNFDTVFLEVKEDEGAKFERMMSILGYSSSGYSSSIHRIPVDSLLELKPCKVDLRKSEFDLQEYLAEIQLYKQFRELNEPDFAFSKDAEFVITPPRRRG